jgi:hypothetical protein
VLNWLVTAWDKFFHPEKYIPAEPTAEYVESLRRWLAETVEKEEKENVTGVAPKAAGEGIDF